MTDAQKQALQRFGATLIAEIVTLGVAMLQSPELRELIIGLLGEGSLVTTLVLALLPAIVLAVGKLAAGPTQKAPDVADTDAPRSTRRRRTVTAEPPGLFG